MRKIIVCMPMDEGHQKKIFEGLKDLAWLNESEIDFVHIFKQDSYPYMIPPTIYPSKEQKVEIKKTIEEIFEGLTKTLDFKKKTVHCTFNDNQKIGVIDYLNENNADLAIVHTREKHGIANYFSSSFTEYLIKHAPCNVLVLRDS